MNNQDLTATSLFLEIFRLVEIVHQMKSQNYLFRPQDVARVRQRTENDSLLTNGREILQLK